MLIASSVIEPCVLFARPGVGLGGYKVGHLHSFGYMIADMVRADHTVDADVLERSPYGGLDSG